MRPGLRRRQQLMLSALTSGPLTAHQVADKLTNATPDDARTSLRRLEDRELVRRLGDRPYQWELTAAGRQTLEPTT